MIVLRQERARVCGEEGELCTVTLCGVPGSESAAGRDWRWVGPWLWRALSICPSVTVRPVYCALPWAEFVLVATKWGRRSSPCSEELTHPLLRWGGNASVEHWGPAEQGTGGLTSVSLTNVEMIIPVTQRRVARVTLVQPEYLSAN